MQIKPVDERDAQWEAFSVTYRVQAWEGDALSAYDVSDCVLREVVEWASSLPSTGTVGIALKIDQGGEVGLLWLTPPPVR